MTSIIIDNIADGMRRRLVARARAHGRSLADEARDILLRATEDETPAEAPPRDSPACEPSPPLGDALVAIWREVGLTDDEFNALRQEVSASKRPAEPMRFD